MGSKDAGSVLLKAMLVAKVTDNKIIHLGVYFP